MIMLPLISGHQRKSAAKGFAFDQWPQWKSVV